MALRQSIAPGHWTYDDYAGLPDDGKRYEVTEGELCEMPAARTRHRRISLLIAAALLVCENEHSTGQVFPMQTDVLLSPTNVVQQGGSRPPPHEQA